ncbi:metacaspase-like protein [Plasmodium berghei]|uniref:Metacaspase-2, putative n=2 Tax=Plasmodium berghei TaxID=5821 RepID=A0A509APC8_PLABA|nr:metacaspase-2, putative [Plasmodium berghei ANKA]SCL95848.1 metacaspase-like protein [Plasmodium berghei]SCM16298.1 metacaspase-like protein [Plasmodium berghei]SCN27521.1 metacaspase-like protein [Plasmodium berghei]VUC57405.1 metacaspase-2, putative [Plasmodium berghei ANKA]|eukprot:XP_034423176.1 metacaspase-2, putative [Plasmodium berghei ANKA]
MRNINIYSPLYSSYENINIYKQIRKINDHSEISTANISCDTKGRILVKDAENEKIRSINKNMTQSLENLEKNIKNKILCIPPRENNIKDLAFFQNINQENYVLNGYNIPPNKIINSVNPIRYAYLMPNNNIFYNKQHSIQNNNVENYINNLNNSLKNQINNICNDMNYTERYFLNGHSNVKKPNISKIADKNNGNNYIPDNAHNLNTKNNTLYNYGNHIYNNYNGDVLYQYNQGVNIYRSMSSDNINNTRNRYSRSLDNNNLAFLGSFVPLIPNNNIKTNTNTKMSHINDMINLSFIPKNYMQRSSSSYLLNPLKKDKQYCINVNGKVLNPNDNLKKNKNNNKKHSFNFSDYLSFCENPMRSASIEQSVGSSISYTRRKIGKDPSITKQDKNNTLRKIYNFLFPYNQKEPLKKKYTKKKYNPKHDSINYTQLKHSSKNESFYITNSNSNGAIQHLYHTNNRKNSKNNSNICNENYAHNSLINRNGNISSFNNIQNERKNNAYNNYYEYCNPEQMINASFLYNTHHNNNNITFRKQHLSKNNIPNELSFKYNHYDDRHKYPEKMGTSIYKFTDQNGIKNKEPNITDHLNLYHSKIDNTNSLMQNLKKNYLSGNISKKKNNGKISQCNAKNEIDPKSDEKNITQIGNIKTQCHENEKKYSMDTNLNEKFKFSMNHMNNAGNISSGNDKNHINYNFYNNNLVMQSEKQIIGKNQNTVKNPNDANLTFSNVHQHINSIPKTRNNPKGPNMENTTLSNNYKNNNILYLPNQYNNINTNNDAKTRLQNIEKFHYNKNYSNTKDGISGNNEICGKNTLQHKDSYLLNYQNIARQSQINTRNAKGNMMRSNSDVENPINKLKEYNIDKLLYPKSSTYNVNNDKKEYIKFEQKLNPNSINHDFATSNNKSTSLNPLEKLESKYSMENKNNTIHGLNNLFNNPKVLDTADNDEKNKNNEITSNPNLAQINLNGNYIDLINNDLLNIKKIIYGSSQFDTKESELNINDIKFKSIIMNSHERDFEKLKKTHNRINNGNNISTIDGINEILLSMSKGRDKSNIPLNALNEESKNNELYEKLKHNKHYELIKKKQKLKSSIFDISSSNCTIKNHHHRNLDSIVKSQEFMYFKMKTLMEAGKKALGNHYNNATAYKNFDSSKNKMEKIAIIHRNGTDGNDFVSKKLVISSESFRQFFNKHRNDITYINSSNMNLIDNLEYNKSSSKDTNNLWNLKNDAINATKKKVNNYKMNASSELATTDSESHCLGKKKALIIALSYNGLLEGCVNDATQICKHLIESFNFNELILLNDCNFCYKNYVAQKATKKNIINHLRDFIINSNNGDILFFYYCGYSTKIIDSKFSENNNFALLPQDYSNNKYIYSNEICHIIKKLKGGKQLCVIFDTTYSSYFVPTSISITYNKSINATELSKNEHLPFSYKKNTYSFKTFGRIRDRHIDPIYVENVKKPENNKFPEKKHIKCEKWTLVPSIFFFSPDFRDRNEYELLMKGKSWGLLTYCIGKSIELLKSNFSYHDVFLLSSQILLNIKQKYKIKYINFRLSFLNEHSPDDIKFLSHESLYLYKKRQIEEPLWKTSIRLGSINESIKSKFSTNISELSLNLSKMCLLIFIKDIQFFSKTKIDTSIEYFASCFIKPKNVNVLCVRRKNTKPQKIVRDKIFFLEYIILALASIKNAKFYVELFKKKKKNYFVARSVFNIKNKDGRFSLKDIIGIIDLNVKHIIEN